MSVLTRGGSAVLRKSASETYRLTGEERDKRLKDSKQRAIGVDKDALDAQVAEVRARKAAELAEEKAYASSLSAALSGVDAAAEMEAISAERNAAEMRAYWRAQADRSVRREWDINDPDALKKTLPPTALETIGPSSFQVFESELTSSPDAIARKAREFAAANAAIAAEKRRIAEMEAAAEAAEMDAFAATVMTVTQREWDASTVTADEARKLRDENKRLAMERKSRDRADRTASVAAESAHVVAASSSALLTEARGQSYSAVAVGGSRYRVDHFKGFSQQEADAIRAEQARQRDELAAKRAAEKAEALAEADLWSQASQAAYELERQLQREDAEAKRKYYLEIKQQQREAKVRATATK